MRGLVIYIHLDLSVYIHSVVDVQKGFAILACGFVVGISTVN